MAAIGAVGICCMCISVWGIIQMAFMGFFYSIEATTLIHDIEPHEGEYTTFEDFIEKCHERYAILSLNCYIVAGAYVVALIASILCIRKNRKIEEKLEELKGANDDVICMELARKKVFAQQDKKQDKNIKL